MTLVHAADRILTRQMKRAVRRDPEFREWVINDLSHYGQFGRDCGKELGLDVQPASR